MSKLVQAEITDCFETVPGIWVTEFFAPSLAQEATPGQFLHIRCGEYSDPLLRRPISIHAVYRQSGLVKIMFQVVGKGTAWLANRREGLIDIMGPLGRGFNLYNVEQAGLAGADPRLMVVGGGIGAAPLYFLLQELARADHVQQVKVLLGARTAETLLISDAARLLGFAVSVATDDGSTGHRGLVTDLLAEELKQKTDFVYACGPSPMLKTLCGMLKDAGVPGEVSVEERMACGVGACLSCVCQIRDASGMETYRHACVDGPVFPAGEVLW